MKKTKPALSKLTISRLRRVKAAILREPEAFDQLGAYAMKPSCLTPCCLLGWAASLFAPQKIDAELTSHHVGAKALGLGIFTSSRLWYPSRWPRSIWVRYAHCKTRRGKAKAGADRIDHFIKTDGRE